MQAKASFIEAVVVALASLRSSKLRSFLTLLGIILSTTTLIVVMSVIHGMDVYIAQNVSDMGVDGFRVVRMAFLGNWDPKKYLELLRKNPQIIPSEYEFLKERVTLTREIGIRADRREKVNFRERLLDAVQLIGGTPNFCPLTSTDVATGRFFTEAENQRRLNVAFIGNDLRVEFFPNVDPIGKVIQIQGRPFEVIGVAKTQGSVFGQSKDNFAVIPIDTYFKMYGSRSGMAIVALAQDRYRLAQAQDEIRMLLRAFRHLRPGQEDNFAIISSDALVGAWDQLTGVIAATAVAVVSVFMVVGGVVIMNIMLAVVTERTHEIGIRKSVGARNQDILNQFLVESSVLAASGGLLGVILAVALTLLGGQLTPVPMSVPMTAVVIGVGLSAAVGLFFGIYPAQRAAKLDPIEALRVER
ncbi:MAG: ABC transporter permease [Bryobacteraceae bacterium]|nr:ABC transporter permease [Bryobacteraceae bacterium]